MASERQRWPGWACWLLAGGAAACFGGPGVTPIRTPFNRGVWHHENGELDAAVAQYRLALLEDPRDVRARFNLAAGIDEQAHRRQPPDAALVQQAEQQYLRVLADDPDNVRAAVNLAALEHERGDVAAARQRLQHAVGANPDLAMPRVALALLQQSAGDTGAAEATLREALVYEPSDFAANLQLGRLLAATARRAAARLALQAALASEPHAAEALLALAALEADDDRTGEALALVEQVLLADDANFAGHQLAVELCERRGRLEDALFHAWRARDLDRAVPPAIDHAARLRQIYTRLLAAQ